MVNEDDLTASDEDEEASVAPSWRFPARDSSPDTLPASPRDSIPCTAPARDPSSLSQAQLTPFRPVTPAQRKSRAKSSAGPYLQPSTPAPPPAGSAQARARESSRKSSPRDFWAVLLRPAIPALYQLII
ncbi:hypothetical protein TIFTF001_045259 [Ficus carica]|uniref:Uncharacterized protein n=1 Tax=Ficus carica TaxID=3494 RepID=A0AA87YXI1_FICCA|nr:hypothetical protein TIFTF001_045259 [Ficus carica]